MHDINDHAKKLAEFGKAEAKVMRELLKIHAERCAYLTRAAQSPQAASLGLSADTTETVIEPKE